MCYNLEIIETFDDAVRFSINLKQVEKNVALGSDYEGSLGISLDCYIINLKCTDNNVIVNCYILGDFWCGKFTHVITGTSISSPKKVFVTYIKFN